MTTEKTKKLKNLNVKIEEELLKDFRIKTLQNNEKMTNVLRNFIKQYIKNH